MISTLAKVTNSLKSTAAVIAALFMLTSVMPLYAGEIEAGRLSETDTDAGAAARPADISSFSVLPFGFYTSDTGIAVGCMSVWDRRRSQEGDSLQLFGSATYTWMRQAELSFGADYAWREDRNRVEMEGGFFNTPSVFYGVGQVDGVEETYTVQKVEGRGTAFFRLYRSLFAGPAFDFKAGTYTGIETGSLIELYTGQEGSSEHSVGAGCTFMWDSRSDPLYPDSGMLLLVKPLLFPQDWNSGPAFQRIELDVRSFFALNDEVTLALRGYAVAGFGELPFMYLPQLGGLFVGRGYPYGRYQDSNLAAVQGEVRWKMTPRWGLTLFAEAGEVAAEAADFSLEEIKPGIGAGVRFAVSPPSEAHIRFDVGLTPDSFGVYITLMEAF